MFKNPKLGCLFAKIFIHSFMRGGCAAILTHMSKVMCRAPGLNVDCRYLFLLSPCPGPCDHRLHLCPLESESPVMTLNSHLEVK